MSKALTIIAQKVSEAANLPAPNSNLSLATAWENTSLGSIKSYGGATLAENAAKADIVLAKAQELQRIFNRSHSQFTWKHLNISYHSPLKNIRQVAAELARKRDALNEAKWRAVETEIRIKEIENELDEISGIDDPDLEFKIIRLHKELAQIKEGMATGTTYIEGALKDVQALGNIYDDLMKQYENFTEEDFEKAEIKSHLQRSITQCIRDVRQSGCISKGEQEYLEQIGVNPSRMQTILRRWVEEETKAERWDVADLHNFVDELSTKLVPVAKIKLDVLGIDSEIDQSILYK